MVPRLRRHCSAVRSRNTQTVLSCDSPRSAADRGESVLKPLSAFFVSGRERCADIVPVFARPAPNSRGQRQSRSRSWRTHRSGYSTCFFTPKLLRDSAGFRRDSSGIRRDSSGILVGFKRDSAGFKRDSSGIRRDSSGIQLSGTYLSYGFRLNPSGIQPRKKN